MEEKIYHDQMKEYARLLQYLLGHRSISSSFQCTWNELKEALRYFYPHRSTSQIENIIQSAEKDFKQTFVATDLIEFLHLFLEDDEGHTGHFLSTLTDQMTAEKNLYIEQVKDLLIGHP